MEVKELQKAAALPERVQNQSAGGQRSIRSLSSAKAQQLPSEPVAIEVDSVKASPRGEARAALNEVINFGNVASEITGKLEDLVRTVGGIVDQVSDARTPTERVPVLEKEAKEIVKEIKVTARSASELKTPSNNTEEKLNSEVERALVKTLKSLLPEGTQDGLGLKEVNFSTAENIVATRASVEKARRRIEDLRSSVEETNNQIRNAAGTLEVAIQNGEASQSSIRDVDAALSLVSETRLSISREPEQALQSASKLNQRSTDLLK